MLLLSLYVSYEKVLNFRGIRNDTQKSRINLKIGLNTCYKKKNQLQFTI